MATIIDITGRRFGQLIVVARAGSDNGITWLCKCDCGNETVAKGTNLRAGSTESCGCYRREAAIKQMTTHGHAKTPEYNRYNQMIQRCYNPKNQNYKHYGARGIKVHEEWLRDYRAFRTWVLENLGPQPPEQFIDRIDNNGNYEPGNIRWATRTQQNNNKRQANQYTARKRQAKRHFHSL